MDAFRPVSLFLWRLLGKVAQRNQAVRVEVLRQTARQGLQRPAPGRSKVPHWPGRAHRRQPAEVDCVLLLRRLWMQAGPRRWSWSLRFTRRYPPVTRRSIMACISLSPHIRSSAYQLAKLPGVGVANAASMAAASAFAFRIDCRYASRS